MSDIGFLPSGRSRPSESRGNARSPSPSVREHFIVQIARLGVPSSVMYCYMSIDVVFDNSDMASR